MIYDEFVFLDSTSTQTSTVYNVAPSAESLNLQVKKISSCTLNLSVMGETDATLSDDGWVTIAAIDSSDFSVKSGSTGITTEGVFSIGIGGMKKIKIVNNESTAYGKVKAFGLIS